MSGPLLSVAEEVHGAAWDVGLVVAAVVVNIGVPDEGVVAERARTNLDLRELMVSMEAACKKSCGSSAWTSWGDGPKAGDTAEKVGRSSGAARGERWGKYPPGAIEVSTAGGRGMEDAREG